MALNDENLPPDTEYFDTQITVSFHPPGQTFTFKTLKSMIELQAEWTLDDLKRLKLLK